MQSKPLLIASFSVFLSGAVMAGTMGAIGSEPWSRVVTLSAGPAWTDAGRTQTFYLVPFVENTYSADKHTATLATGELFLGLQRWIHSNLIAQLGLAGVISSTEQLRGDIWEDADPVFNNFFYAYRLNHQHLAVKGKVLADMNCIVQPYLAASVGVGRNRATDYTMVSKLPAVTPAAGFGNHTTTALAYTVDAGVEKQLNAHWRAGVGYEFADWGRSSLALAPNQTLGHGLELNHWTVNQLQFSIGYVG